MKNSQEAHINNKFLKTNSMESKLIKFVNENKWFIVFYIVWSFIHLIFYFSSNSSRKGFWPFRFNINAYDFLELFVYLGLPFVIFIIWKLAGNDIKQVIRLIVEKLQKHGVIE